MSTCLESIKNNVTSVSITKDTDYPFIVSPTTNKLYDFTLNTTQTIYININFIKNTNDTIFITIINKKTLDTVRTSKVNRNTIINTDLDDGTYYICIRTLFNTVEGSIKINYLSYKRNVTLDDINVYGGENYFITSLKQQRPDVLCDVPLKYTFIDGNLPTGITLDSKGRLYGRLPIIDDENMNNFPSYNLYNDKFNYVEPIGTNYQFTVKVEVMGNDKDNYDIQTFCISMVNNWSLTQDYLDDYEVVSEFESFVEVENKSPVSLCPPCDSFKIIDSNNILYEFDINNKPHKSIKINDDDIWAVNRYESITKGRFISHAPFITKVSQLNYVIEHYTIGYDKNDGINIPQSQFTDMSEYIILPYDIDLLYVRDWVINNYNELLLQGHDSYIIDKYIDKTIDGSLTMRDGYYHLDLTVLDYPQLDPTAIYTQTRENILKNEPMYIKSTAFDYILNVDIDYGKY